MSKQRNGTELFIIENNSLAATSIRHLLGDKDVHFRRSTDLASICVASGKRLVVILDATTLGMAAEKFVPLVRLRLSSAHILILAEDLSEDLVCRLLGSGAHGFVCYQELSQLPSAIKAVLQGHLWVKPRVLELYVRYTSEPDRCRVSASMFTPRELAVLGLLQCRLSNKEIGTELKLAERTVKFHLSNICGKLGVHDRSSVVAALQYSGLNIPPSA